MRIVVDGPANGGLPRAPGVANPVSLASAVLRGWGTALVMPGVVLLLWLCNVVAGTAATIPFAVLLHGHIGDSAMNETAFTEVGWDTAAEFLFGNESGLQLAFATLVPGLIAYLLLSVWLTGGVLDRLAAGERRPWRWFFDACSHHFWVLLRLSLLALALFAAVVGLPYIGLHALVAQYAEAAVQPAPAVYATWAHWAIAFLLASWVSRVYDYARAVVILQPGRGAVAALIVAVRFVLRRGAHTLVLWLLLCAGAAILLAGCLATRRHFGMDSMDAMWLALAVGQVSVGVRILGWIARLDGQMRFLRGATGR